MKEIKFNFEDLKVYQKSLDFVHLAYKISREFPKNEMYGLTSQFTRAVVSISLKIALGSVKECVVCSTIATKQYFIKKKLIIAIEKT